MGDLPDDLIKIGVGGLVAHGIANSYAKEKGKQSLKGRFCEDCGKVLTRKNIKGKCISCNRIICNFCGKVKEGKLFCIECRDESLYEGVIPIWVVVIGFIFYIIPGIVLLIIRNNQLRKKGLK